MNRIIFSLMTIAFLTSCNNLDKKATENSEKRDFPPEPDKSLREKYEALEKLKKSGCILFNPDTSLNKIIIRDSESANFFIRDQDIIDSFDQYNFYSKTKLETLTLTQHPGDGKYQISIFKVKYTVNFNLTHRQLMIDTFKTEKGIRLGMSKKQIIERLGNCYAPIDSLRDYIELYYKLESPNDSKTHILKSNNMPSYYASYKFRNNKLDSFEFGFEYP